MLFFTFFHHDQPILDPLNIRGPWGKSAIHQVNWLLQQRRGSVTITDLTRREDVTEVAGGGGDVASTCFVIRYTYVYLSIRSHSHLTIVSIVIYTIFPNALVFLFFLGTLFWTNTRPWSFSRLSWKLVRHVSILERISSTSWISAVYILCCSTWNCFSLYAGSHLIASGQLFWKYIWLRTRSVRVSTSSQAPELKQNGGFLSHVGIPSKSSINIYRIFMDFPSHI